MRLPGIRTERARLLQGDLTKRFLAAVFSLPRVKSLLSNDRLAPDVALIGAWARSVNIEPADCSSGHSGQATTPDCDLYGENGERLQYRYLKVGDAS